MIKNCKWCNKEFKPKYGNQKYCSKECSKQAQRSKFNKKYYREYYRNHREAISRSRKKYYNANRDEILEQQRNYYWQHKEHYRDYNHEHKIELNFYKRFDQCCKEHGGIDNCPFDDCIL